MDRPDISELRLRAYFATVIGQARAPFGNRRAFQVSQLGTPVELAENSTRDKVLFVTVSRSDALVATADVIFSQQSSGALNDFVASFPPPGIFRFVLYPGETITIAEILAPVAMTLAVGSESY